MDFIPPSVFQNAPSIPCRSITVTLNIRNRFMQSSILICSGYYTCGGGVEKMVKGFWSIDAVPDQIRRVKIT